MQTLHIEFRKYTTTVLFDDVDFKLQSVEIGHTLGLFLNSNDVDRLVQFSKLKEKNISERTDAAR
jgi:hypothetical protein